MPVNAEQLASPPVGKKRSAAGKPKKSNVTIREAVESDLADTVSFLCIRDRLEINRKMGI
jgi:hypothetical protein